MCSQIIFCHLRTGLCFLNFSYESDKVSWSEWSLTDDESTWRKQSDVQSSLIWRRPIWQRRPGLTIGWTEQFILGGSHFWVKSCVCVSLNDSQGRDRWSSQRSSSFADVSKLPPPPMMVNKVLSYNVQWDIVHLRITGTMRRVLEWWPEIGLQAFHRLWTR